MRDEEWKVEYGRQHRAPTERGAREEVRDRRAAEDTDQRGRGGSPHGEHERLAQLRIAAESRDAACATGDDEFSNRSGEEQQEQRSAQGGDDGEEGVL